MVVSSGTPCPCDKVNLVETGGEPGLSTRAQTTRPRPLHRTTTPFCRIQAKKTLTSRYQSVLRFESPLFGPFAELSLRRTNIALRYFLRSEIRQTVLAGDSFRLLRIIYQLRIDGLRRHLAQIAKHFGISVAILLRRNDVLAVHQWLP